MEDVTKKFGLDTYVRLNSRVVSSIWSDGAGKWSITIETTDLANGKMTTTTDEADILVNGSGILNRKKLPDIPGLDTFKGTIVHSAAWDPNLDWAGKRVGIIGNGSSAIQILPEMAPTASKLVEYVRSTTWVIPEFLTEFTPDGKNFEYAEEQKKQWRDDPTALRDMRRKMEHAFNTYFGIFKESSPQQAYVREAFTSMMKARLNGDEVLIEKLVPQFPVGCRRITPGTGYLEALQTENVKVNTDPITHITEKGIKTRNPQDGKETEEPLDIIVAATGFDVSFSPAWETKGHNGADLAQRWKDDAEAYLGIFAPQMPNYLIYNGPNCPIGHGSLMGVMEATTTLILNLTHKIASQGYQAFIVKDDVVREYNEYTQALLADTVWASPGCSSWYKRRRDNKVTAMYAGSVLHYREMLANFRMEDLDWVGMKGKEGKKVNRFQFMGNGTTQLEADGKLLGEYLEC